MIDKTFCDFLLRQGFKFSPDTVIFDISDILKILFESVTDHVDEPMSAKSSVDTWLNAIKSKSKDIPSRPPFPHLFIEAVVYDIRFAYWITKQDDLGFFSGFKHGLNNFGSGDPPHVGYSCLVSIKSDSKAILTHPGRMGVVNAVFGLLFDEQGMLTEIKMTADPTIATNHMMEVGLNLDHDQVDIVSPQISEALGWGWIMACVDSFIRVHERGDIAPVSHSRQVRRQIVRRTGKLPSPYYEIKQGRPQRGSGSSGKTSTGGKKVEHTRRGHFRAYGEHKLPQFAYRTFWIPPIRVNEGKSGRKREKVYQIVPLP